MAPDDPAGTRPGPVVLRIKLRYDDVEALIERFASHVGRSGLFLPTRSLQPIGTEVKFELRLATDQAVLVGLGRVQSVKEPDPERPKAAHGIGVELMRVTREGRELILKLLARRKQLGLPEVGLPGAEDVDDARRMEAEAGDAAAVPREAANRAASGPVVGEAASGPVVREAASGPASGPVVREAGGPASGPVAVASAAAAAASSSAFTAPRRSTGPVTIPKAVAIEPLPAEAPRRRRRLVSEVIESASGPVRAAAKSVAVSGLDEEVDVGRVLARARTLATGDLDQELELLRDQQAAPRREITIEAASAELARQLGGAAVRKDKSQRWAPPPAVATEGPAVGDAEEAEAKAKPEPEEVSSEPAEAKVEPAAEAKVAPAAVAPAAEAKVAPADEEPAAEAKVEPVDAEPADEAKAELADAEHRAEAKRTAAPDVDEAMIDAAASGDLAVADTARADEDLDEGIIERDEEDLAHLRSGEARTRTFGPANIDQIVTEPLRAPERWDGDHANNAAAYIEPAADEHEVDDGQIADEIHQLSEADLEEEEESEFTQIGSGLVDPHAFDEATYIPGPDPSPGPAEHTALAAPLSAQRQAHSAQLEAHLSSQLDARLAEAAEEDDDDDGELGLGTEVGLMNRDRALSVGGEYDSAIVEELVDAAPTYDPVYGSALAGARATPLPDGPTAAAPPDDSLDAALAVPPDEEIAEEIDDFEILAEADADDADLLAADGEAEHTASGVFALPGAPAGTGAPGRSPSFNDFATRLDLGEESDLYAPAPEPDFYERRPVDPRELSAGHALAALEDADEAPGFPTPSTPSSGVPVSYGRDGSVLGAEREGSGPTAGFSPPHEFDQSDVIAIPPELRRDHKSRVAARSSPAAVVLRSATSMATSAARARAGAGAGADDDLEIALEALDVDLDDLSIPHAPPDPVRDSGRPARAAGRVVRPSAQTPSGRIPRPKSDDGVLIDFDDDEDDD